MNERRSHSPEASLLDRMTAVPVDAVVRPEAYATRKNWRLLRRLDLPTKLNLRSGGTTRNALVIDVETTGLSLETDEVIQLAMLPFTYELETGLILEIDDAGAFEGLREPNAEISEEATLITGISSEAVAGKTIDAAIVEALVSKADLVIAHNASFDRVMVEKHWPIFSTVPWGCSYSSIEWLREGFSAGKLDYLGYQFGWFYDAHSALADCQACLALLAQTLPRSGRLVLDLVRDTARSNEYLIPATDAPFDSRLKLKERGYRWRPEELPHGKVWWTITNEPEPEIAWLCDEIYGRRVEIPAHPITARNRYSDRIWSFAS